MRFSIAALFSVLSVSLISNTVALPIEDTSLAARDIPTSDVYARDDGNTLWARAKAPKVSFHLEKGKLSSKDRQLAEDQAEDALEHYGYKAGTVVYAYHLSNGESVEHITIEPAGNGKKIHAYRDGVFTQGDERRSKRNLFVRAKAPKVSFHLEKGKLSSKDRQLAKEQAEDALEHYGYKAGTVVYAYHLSNGESVEHITIEPAGNGKKIHAYRDGVFTQGDERRSKRDLFVRAKAPKVTFHLEKGKLNSKDRQLAEEQAEDALKHYGYKAGTVVYAYHLSNGESVEHITIEPAGDGKKIHAYRDGIFTQGEERRH